VRRLLRRGVILGAVAGLTYAVWRYVESRAPAADGPGYEPQPFPMPPRPVAAPTPAAAADTRTAVEPDPDGNCPIAFPIKGKLSTGIYHRPGAFAYERTRADRCYRDDEAAEADGLRASKR